MSIIHARCRYIAPYPIAMAVRSTNVYEDQALGIWNDEEREEEDGDDVMEKEKQFEKSPAPRSKVYGQYLFWHARRQLAFGASIVLLTKCV